MEFVHRPYIPEETVAAIATPPGEGGIAVIRISGKEALSVADAIFSKDVFSIPSHTVRLGTISDAAGKILDEVLLLVMKAPKSFTGEDTVEIHCHGGSLVTRKILERTLEAGAGLASPGQFAFKAFMNGKIDLTKAEAIGSVISAQNERAFEAAALQLEGALSRKITSLQNRLFEAAAVLEASVDFPEEGLEFASPEELAIRLCEVAEEIRLLSQTFHEGKILHEGLTLSLIGPPNAGKSSLMNALLGKERAIVTAIPGTTRDVLEDQLYLDGLHCKILDTAGIRETEETIEQEGIRRSKAAMQSSDLILFITDASVPLSAETEALLKEAPPEKTLLVRNKSDVCTCKPDPIPRFSQVFISALTGQGIEELKRAVSELIWKNGPPAKGEIMITKLRHKEALDRSFRFLSSVISGLREEVSPEFLSFDMRQCLFELATILGVNISEELLTSIFSKFCLGK